MTDRTTALSKIEKSGPVVVFESGLSSHKEIWKKVFSVIGSTNTVIAYDRPGVGRSSESKDARGGGSIVEAFRSLLRSRI